jgi:hypothetical protein
MIAQELAKKRKDLEVVAEKSFSLDTPDGSVNLRPDLVVLDRRKKRGWILDPVICSESLISNWADEKIRKYTPLIPKIKESYHLEQVTVHGLPFGARGLVPQGTEAVLDSLGLVTKAFRQKLSIAVLRGSLMVLGVFGGPQ